MAIGNQITAEQVHEPIAQSHLYDDLERAMASVFRQMLKDHLINDIDDIYHYATPFLGGKTVVERFSKLNGLAVLRRDDGGFSDKVMAIILANWQSLASERGLAFLQFVLDMLYPNQNEIVRLWHDKSRAKSYPNYLYESASSKRFLTSRIRIKLNADIDLSELSELAPTLRRLVPAHIVPEVAVYVDIDNKKIGMALGADKFHVADFSPVRSDLKHDSKANHDENYRYNGYKIDR
nr:hypothetical protein [uncultured Moraxella sp.]